MTTGRSALAGTESGENLPIRPRHRLLCRLFVDNGYAAQSMQPDVDGVEVQYYISGERVSLERAERTTASTEQAFERAERS